MVIFSNGKKRPKRAEGMQSVRFDFLVREGVTSLQDPGRSDRRISSGQEGKWFYAAKASRGHQFLGVSTKSVR